MSNNQSPDDEIIRQAYRATAQAEPGPALDARILRAAHAALTTPARKTARWSWLVLPLSAAAVAILVTTLALQWRETPSMPPLDSVAVNASPPVIAQHEVAKAEGAAKPDRQHAELKIASAKPTPKAEHRGVTPTATVKNEAALQKQPALQSATAAPQAPAAVEPLAGATPAETGASISATAEPRAFAPRPPAAQRQAPLTDRLAEVESLQSKAANGAETPAQKQIAEIRKLKHEGKLEAAKKALAALRKQFPQYPLPEDLRALIEPVTEENK